MESPKDHKHTPIFYSRIFLRPFQVLGTQEKIYLSLLLLFILDYAVPCIFYSHGPRSLAVWLLQENGVYESAGTLSCLLASIFLGIAYFKYPVANNFFLFKTRRNIFYIILAAFLFFVAGEEVSWGQKLLGFRVPELISSINYQKELNIHNLKIIQGANNALATSASRLLLAYLILLPMVVAAFPTFNRFFRSMGLPVGSIMTALLTLVNYFASVQLGRLEAFQDWTNHGLPEIFESNLEIILFVLALEFFFSAKKAVLEGSGQLS